MFDIDTYYLLFLFLLLFSFFYADLLLTSCITYIISRVLRFVKQDYRTAFSVSLRSSVPVNLLFVLVCLLVYVFDPYKGDGDTTFFMLSFLFLAAYFLKLMLLSHLYRKTYGEKLGKTLKGLIVSVYLLIGSWALILFVFYFLSVFFFMIVSSL